MKKSLHRLPLRRGGPALALALHRLGGEEVGLLASPPKKSVEDDPVLPENGGGGGGGEWVGGGRIRTPFCLWERKFRARSPQIESSPCELSLMNNLLNFRCTGHVISCGHFKNESHLPPNAGLTAIPPPPFFQNPLSKKPVAPRSPELPQTHEAWLKDV